MPEGNVQAKPRAKRQPRPVEGNEPWLPIECELPEASAIQAMARGDATPDQQQRATKWLIETACGAYDLSFRPSGDRDTAFAEGRRFVGLQIVKILKLNLSVYRKKENPND